MAGRYLKSHYDPEITLNNMKELRTKAGYTQVKLAEIMNVPQGYVSKWENGKAKPDFDNLVRLWRLLHGLVIK